MNLQEYVLKYGTKALFDLAEKCEKSPGYMQNLLYTVNSGHVPPKCPGKKLAAKMVKFTKGQLTLEGLSNPVNLPRSKERPRLKKGEKLALLEKL